MFVFLDVSNAGMRTHAAFRKQESLDDLSEVLLASLEKLRLQYNFPERRNGK